MSLTDSDNGPRDGKSGLSSEALLEAETGPTPQVSSGTQRKHGSRADVPGSGGPRTAAGKAKVSRNALKHGVNSESPTAGGESEEDWLIILERI